MGPLRRKTVTRHLSFSGATPRAPLANVENIAAKRPRLSKSATKNPIVVHATNPTPIVAIKSSVLAESLAPVEFDIPEESAAPVAVVLPEPCELPTACDIPIVCDVPVTSNASSKPPVPSRPVARVEPGVPAEPISDPIAVLLRVRPLSRAERKLGEPPALTSGKTDEVVHIRPRTLAVQSDAVRQEGHATFRFSRVMHPDTSQRNVFATTTRCLVERLIDGRSAVLLAYGQTGAGKTWTIQGDGSDPGVLPRALRLILASIATVTDSSRTDAVSPAVRALTGCAVQHAGNEELLGDEPLIAVDSDTRYTVHGSYLEVYNDQCYDLFKRPRDTDDDAPAALRRPPLRLKERRGGDVYAAGATEVVIGSVADARALLAFGQTNRRVAHTNANARSSRSHAVFSIVVRRKPADAPGPITTARLMFVDLAGNERTSRTKATGMRLREAASINKSLMNLGRCLKDLRHNQRALAAGDSSKTRIVPFRSSKLTRLLQPALMCGAAVIIVCASPALADADDTIHTLRCAAVARELTVLYAPRRPPLQAPPARSNGGVRTRQAAAVALGRIGKDRQELGTAKKNNARVAVLVKENAALRKSIALERMEKEEEHCARVEAEREMRQAYELVESLRDRIDSYEAQMADLEVKIRSEVVNETEKIIEEIQSRHDQELDEARAEHKVVQKRFSLITKTTRKTFAQRVARRASMAVQQNIIFESEGSVCGLDDDTIFLDNQEGEDNDDDILFRDNQENMQDGEDELKLLALSDFEEKVSVDDAVTSENLELDHVTADDVVLSENDEVSEDDEELSDVDSFAEDDDAPAEGDDALAEGDDALAEGDDALAEGDDALAEGDDALAEDYNALTEGDDALAEGDDALAGEANSLAGDNSLTEDAATSSSTISADNDSTSDVADA